MSLISPRLPQPAGASAAGRPEHPRRRPRRRRPVRGPGDERRGRGLGPDAPSASWSAVPTCASPRSRRPGLVRRPSRPSPGPPASRSPPPPSNGGPTSAAVARPRAGPAATGHHPRHRPGARRRASTTCRSSRAPRWPTRLSTARSSPSDWPPQDGLSLGSALTMQGAGDRVTYRVVGHRRWRRPADRRLRADGHRPAGDRAGRLRRRPASPASTSALAEGADPATVSTGARVAPHQPSRTSCPRPQDLAAALRASTTDFQATTALIAAIALFAGAFLIFNTLSMTVAERIREVGLLRAAGASRGQVTSFMLTQALAIGVVGSLVGLAARRLPGGRRWSPSCGRSDRSPSTVRRCRSTPLVIAVRRRDRRHPRGRPRAGAPGRPDPAGRGAQGAARLARPLATARLRWLAVVFAVVAARRRAHPAASARWRRRCRGPRSSTARCSSRPCSSRSSCRPSPGSPARRSRSLLRFEERLARSSVVRDRSRTALTLGGLTIGLAMIVALGGVGQHARAAAAGWIADVIPGDLVVTSIRPIAADEGVAEPT